VQPTNFKRPIPSKKHINSYSNSNSQILVPLPSSRQPRSSASPYLLCSMRR
jgi:hypothetical protein